MLNANNDPITYQIGTRGKSFLIYLTSLCLIYIIPIVLANRYYIDDLGRAQDGYFGWSSNGRPLADLLMALINLSAESTVDLSPLTLIIAVAIFIACAYLYFCANLKHISSFGAAVTCFLIIANPFLLENLSYKFDVVPMIAALSFMMLPFISYKHSSLGFIFSIIFIVISLCLYQAVIGFFVCLAIIEFLICASSKNNASQRDLITGLIFRAIQLVIAYLIYSKISSLFVFGEYNIEHSKLISADKDGLKTLKENISTFSSMILLYVSGMRFTSMASILSISIYTILTLYRLCRAKKDCKTNFVTYALVLLSPFIILGFSVMHLCLLKYPVISDRVMASFSGFMLLTGISFFSLIKNKKYIGLISIPFIGSLLVYSYAFGSAMRSQADFDTFLSQSIAEDISTYDPDSIRTVMFLGIQPSSSQRENAIRRFPSFSSLVPLYYNDGWWGKALIKMFGINNKIENANYSIIPCEMKLTSKGSLYNTFMNDKYFIVDFRKSDCK